MACAIYSRSQKLLDKLEGKTILEQPKLNNIYKSVEMMYFIRRGFHKDADL
jgi:hypothetical protein